MGQGLLQLQPACPWAQPVLGPSSTLLRSLLVQELFTSPTPGCLQLPVRWLCALNLSEACLWAPQTSGVGVSVGRCVCGVCVGPRGNVSSD